MKDKLTAIYDILTPMERLNLVVAALSRNDAEEARRLKKTSPMRWYWVRDMEHMDHMLKLERIANYLLHLYEYLETKLYVCIGLDGLFESIIFNNEEVSNLLLKEINGKKTSVTSIIIKSASEKNKKICNKLYEIKNKTCECMVQHYLKLKAIKEGFRGFCEESGINYEKAIIWLGLLDVANKMDQLIGKHPNFAEATPDKEFAKNVKEELMRIWR